MSRKLILLRHAQTAGKQAGQRDYDRTLTAEGEAQARSTGHIFVMNSVKPDYVLCSSAERAKQTAGLIMECAGVPPGALCLSEELYEADGEAWITSIRRLPLHSTTALCVGHNPVLSWLAGKLAQRPVDLSPAGFVILDTMSRPWVEFDSEIREMLLTNIAHDAGGF